MKGRNKRREEGRKEGEKERGRKEGSYENTAQDLTEGTKLVSRPDIFLVTGSGETSPFSPFGIKVTAGFSQTGVIMGRFDPTVANYFRVFNHEGC